MREKQTSMIGGGGDERSALTRAGDPAEFDEELAGDVVDPSDAGSLQVPPGLFRQLVADPMHAPELLAELLSITASYGHDMTDHLERAAELLIIQGVHNTREGARNALVKATTDVGIEFTRKALLEKGVPLVAVPISSGVNYVSTRIVANHAIKVDDTEVTS